MDLKTPINFDKLKIHVCSECGAKLRDKRSTGCANCLEKALEDIAVKLEF